MSRAIRLAVPIGGSMVLTAIIAASYYLRLSASPSDVVSVAAMDHFVLTDQSEQPFDSASLQGKVWVGSFFFSECAGTCRLQNMKLAELQQQFGQQGVQFVSITCKPEADTPDVLSRYAQGFNAMQPQWTFLTGDMPYIKQVATEIFDLHIDTATHSDTAILMDHAGTIQGKYRVNDPAEFRRLQRHLERLTGQAS